MDCFHANLNVESGNPFLDSDPFSSLQRSNSLTTFPFIFGSSPLQTGTSAQLLSGPWQQATIPTQSFCMNCWNITSTSSFDFASCCTNDTPSTLQTEFYSEDIHVSQKENSARDLDYITSDTALPSTLVDSRGDEKANTRTRYTSCEAGLTPSSYDSSDETHFTAQDVDLHLPPAPGQPKEGYVLKSSFHDRVARR